MAEHRQRNIRTAKKEALFFKEISRLFLQITMDDQALAGLYINAVKLSPDRSFCTVFFASSQGIEDFQQRLPNLILYKPALRKAISQNIPSRYTPELVFKYDVQVEKQRKLDALFDQLKLEGRF